MVVKGITLEIWGTGSSSSALGMKSAWRLWAGYTFTVLGKQHGQAMSINFANKIAIDLFRQSLGVQTDLKEQEGKIDLFKTWMEHHKDIPGLPDNETLHF